MVLFASVLALLSANLLQCQEGSNRPTDVTVSDLGMHPQQFDGRLVRIQAWLVSGWEGDRFLSDPQPQSIDDGSPAYLWLYCSHEREKQVYGVIGGQVSIYGEFTGYFHLVAKPENNGTFDPGHLQFEAMEVSIPEKQPRTLAAAIRKGNLDEVRAILHSGAKLNVQDEYRSFPLFEAIGSGHTAIAEELLTAGADPKVALGRDTALMLAAWNDNVTIAKALLDRGAPVNANSNGQTALILAAQTCPDGRMVQLLLDAGADPNADSGAALRAAAGNPLVVEKLLAAGADPSAKGKDGDTAESESCDRGEKGHAQVCALIRQALGKK
ncbi:MAG: ankyrin repeat domain-containing protein [Terriglobales bacterium]